MIYLKNDFFINIKQMNIPNNQVYFIKLLIENNLFIFKYYWYDHLELKFWQVDGNFAKIRFDQTDCNLIRLHSKKEMILYKINESILDINSFINQIRG